MKRDKYNNILGIIGIALFISFFIALCFIRSWTGVIVSMTLVLLGFVFISPYLWSISEIVAEDWADFLLRDFKRESRTFTMQDITSNIEKITHTTR